MSEEVKPIPAACFEVLFAARMVYKNFSISHKWHPPYKITEAPPLGGAEWMRRNGERVSSMWKEYKEVLDSLLDHLDSQEGYLVYATTA
ncbi:MAG: hypothetical protein LBE67_17690 [Kocuria palustris]|mgnify:CR=1 FL=1|jgi:hypothetical protein|nr:hypothetical protein [Kocuria palustris]